MLAHPTAHPSMPMQASASSTHRCCAERRLLEQWVWKANKHGVHPSRTVCWVRRKLGQDITLYRASEGKLACAFPCVACRVELLRFDLRVHCICNHSLDWFSGKLSQQKAPESKLTSFQMRERCQMHVK